MWIFVLFTTPGEANPNHSSAVTHRQQLTRSAGVQQHGASVTAGAESLNLRVPSGAQGPTGGQGDQEGEPGQLQHERQKLEDGIPRDVSCSS